MANDDRPNGFSWACNLAGGTGGPITKRYIQKTSTQITKGDWVIWDDSTGTVDIAVSSSPALLGVACETSAASSSAGDTLLVIPAFPWYLFVGQTSGTMSQALIGDYADIEGATGVMEINENATTESVLVMQELEDSYNNTLADANARLLVTVSKSDYLHIGAEL